MQQIHTSDAPEAIGAYSQAIQCDKMIFISGQIALDPKTMELCSDDVGEQIEQVINNLTAICKAAGGDLHRIVKLNVYLLDLKHFAKVNEAIVKHFAKPYPARAVIGVAALPRNAAVEIDAIMQLSSHA